MRTVLGISVVAVLLVGGCAGQSAGPTTAVSAPSPAQATPIPREKSQSEKILETRMSTYAVWPWYRHIQDVSLVGTTWVIATDLTAEGEETSAMCSMVEGIMFSDDSQVRVLRTNGFLTKAEIRGPSGEVLDTIAGMGKDC